MLVGIIVGATRANAEENAGTKSWAGRGGLKSD